MRSITMEPAHVPQRRWTVAVAIGGVVALFYFAVMILANLSCSQWFTRPDAILGLTIAGAGALVLLSSVVWKSSAAHGLLPIACGALTGISVVPSLPILLAVGYLGIGTAGPARDGRDRLVRFGLMVVVAFVVFFVHHALAPIGDAGRC